MGLVDVAIQSFSLGLATPLTAVCVIPLYPGFLAYLSNAGEDAPPVAVLGGLVAAGVIGFMAIVGLVFTTVASRSLTGVVELVSPIAFAILGVVSLVLLTGRSIGESLPTIEPPRTDRPALSALGYGAFFGAIVLPCNPGFIAIFFARSFLFTAPVESMTNFLAFGLGMAAPLLAFALVAESLGQRVIAVLTRHRTLVNRGTGAIMLVISLYYLLVVFDVFGLPP
ncbi:MAG: cytochrome c biogenesis protein CcdA [Salinirussus sp.]